MSDITDEQKAALEWLRGVAEHSGSVSLTKLGIQTYLKPLQDLLSRPVVPDVNDHKAIDALHRRMTSEGWNIQRGTVVAFITALREPATKEIEVFRLEWATRCGDGWDAQCSQHSTREAAEEWAKSLSGDRHIACITVTGPHRQRVPA